MTVARNTGRRENPFSGDLARANSSAAVPRGKKLVYVPFGTPAKPLQGFVHDSFRALVLNPAFSCVVARSAVRRGNYRFGLYARMVAFAMSQPEDVDVNEILYRPTAQEL